MLAVYAAPVLPFGHPMGCCERSSESLSCVIQRSRNLFALRCLPETSKRCFCDFFHVDKAVIAPKGSQALKEETAFPAKRCPFLKWEIGLFDHINSVLNPLHSDSHYAELLKELVHNTIIWAPCSFPGTDTGCHGNMDDICLG